MTHSLEPAEEYDGTITVLVLRDTEGREEIRCSSYEEAIKTVKRTDESATVTKIVDRDNQVVFSSDKMDIRDWEVEWKKEKRRLSVGVEAHDCSYDNKACFSDDLCVQCQMDKVQDQY